MVGKGIAAASAFQSSFQFTTTLFEASSRAVGTFRQDILDYAQGSTQSIESINKALQNAIGQGVDYADSLGVLKEAERLAVAQAGSLDSATSLLVGTLNAYGLGMDQAAKLSDQFSITIRDGKISVEELSALLANVSPIAAAAGIGFDQVGSAIAVLTAQGFKAESAITGVRNIIEGIIKPTGQAADYAAQLGISFNAQALQAKGLNGVLEDVFKATGGNVEKMAQLFTTTEGLGAALALGGKGAGQFADELRLMATETGTTQAAFEKMANSVELGSQRVKNSIEIAFINLGTPLLDEFGAIQTGVAKIFQDIARSLESGGALTPVVAALESFGQQIGAVVSIIADNLPAALTRLDFSGLIDSFGGLGREIANLFGILTDGADITTAEGLATVLQKIVDSGQSLTITVTGIISAFRPLAEAAASATANFHELDQSSQFDFGAFLGSAKLLVDTMSGLGLSLLAVGQAGIDMKRVMDVVFGGVQVLVNTLQLAFDGMAAAVVAPFAAIAAGIVKMSDLFGTGNSEMAQDAQDIVRYFDAIAENASRNADELEQGWNKVTGQATEETGALQGQLDKARTSFGQLKPAIQDSNAALTTQVTGLEDSISAVRRYEESIGVVVTANEKLSKSSEKSGKDVYALAENIKVSLAEGAAGSISIYDTALAGIATKYEQIGGGTVKATGAFKAIDEAAKKSADTVSEATKKSQEWQLKMEELATNKQIKLIEATVTLNVAQIEAQSKQAVAALESITTTIGGSQDLLGQLFGDLNKADARTKFEIQDQIEKENDRLDKQLDLQKELVQAQVDNIRAQTAALQRDMPMIKIDGTGLDLELEAFMWKILEKIRIRANAEFSDYLLGVA
ncbi:MAG: phage tail tape measure protein [Candidatus Contendobacter sp.]|nr:phage tail tape measure protein [Candidatus Contendobacter sp.]